VAAVGISARDAANADPDRVVRDSDCVCPLRFGPVSRCRARPRPSYSSTCPDDAPLLRIGCRGEPKQNLTAMWKLRPKYSMFRFGAIILFNKLVSFLSRIVVRHIPLIYLPVSDNRVK